jgi:hypothetical protein
MTKIKFQGGITKGICSRIAAKNKKRFIQYVDENGLGAQRFRTDEKVNIDMVSYSSSKDFHDQILSILSFMSNVGIPKKWIVYSDGSHSEKHIRIIKDIFNFVEVICYDFSKLSEKDVCDDLEPMADTLINYAIESPYGKKLLYYLNHQIERPTIFLDADILFHSRASEIHALINEGGPGWFLPESSWGCLDSRYKNQNERQHYQVNSGFFILFERIKNTEAANRFLLSLNRNFEHFTEQTIFHILFKANHFLPLDPRVFVLNSSDQFDFSYFKSPGSMAIRHYTGPVRHKMWQRDWKSFINH